MRKLGVLASGALLTFGLFAACAGDEEAKKARDGDGGAGAEAGGGPPLDAGGSGMLPSSAGQGGAPVVAEGGAGGEPVVFPEAGMGGVSTGAEGGAGGAGGSPGIDCPAEPGVFTYSCGEVRDTWNPTFDSATKAFRFETDQLPFPIASGTVDVFRYDASQNQFCGSYPLVPGADAFTVSVDTTSEIVRVRVTDFTLVDVCGSTHTFDPLGAPQCNDLEASGQTGTWPLLCVTRLGACPDQCE